MAFESPNMDTSYESSIVGSKESVVRAYIQAHTTLQQAEQALKDTGSGLDFAVVDGAGAAYETAYAKVTSARQALIDAQMRVEAISPLGDIDPLLRRLYESASSRSRPEQTGPET